MIRCIAIDDEPLALGQLATYISRVPYLELVAKCRDAAEATRELARQPVDLLFVDINMPDLNGLDFVRSLSAGDEATTPTPLPKVIFTTAYSEYAVDSYSVDAVGYLLKPFSFADLEAAANKARLRIERDQIADGFVPQAAQPIAQDGVLFVRNDYRISRIRVADIKYIESMGEYIRIFVEGQDRAIMPLLSMKRIEEMLPADHFMRVHRSFIVNLDKIEEISRLRIIFGDVYIPVGDSYKQRFLDYINARSV